MFKSAICKTTSRYVSETVQDSDIVTMEGKSKLDALYQMVLSSMTLGDP